MRPRELRNAGGPADPAGNAAMAGGTIAAPEVGAPGGARHRARRPLHPHPPGAARDPAPPRRQARRDVRGGRAGEESVFDRRQSRPGHRRLARHRADDRARLRRERRHGVHLVAQEGGVRPGRGGAVARSARVARCRPISPPRPTPRAWPRSSPAREPKLHILVNNAGANWGAPLAEYPDAAWDKVLALNVKAVFHLTRACLPQLEAAATPDDPARVINIGSIDGLARAAAGDLRLLVEQGGRAPPDPRAGHAARARSTSPSTPSRPDRSRAR